MTTDAAKKVRDQLCIECVCTFDRGCGCLEAISAALAAARPAPAAEGEVEQLQKFAGHIRSGGSFSSPDAADMLDRFAALIRRLVAERDEARAKRDEGRAGYKAEKRCCSVCDRKKTCHVCGDQTLMACSDCAINFGATVYVCTKPACRDKHELKCFGPGLALPRPQEGEPEARRALEIAHGALLCIGGTDSNWSEYARNVANEIAPSLAPTPADAQAGDGGERLRDV